MISERNVSGEIHRRGGGGKGDKYFDLALLWNAVKEFKKYIHWFELDSIHLQRVTKADEKAVISSI